LVLRKKFEDVRIDVIEGVGVIELDHRGAARRRRRDLGCGRPPAALACAVGAAGTAEGRFPPAVRRAALRATPLFWRAAIYSHCITRDKA
jgi:hypothetical protein